jgi:hypothetical protein
MRTQTVTIGAALVVLVSGPASSETIDIGFDAMNGGGMKAGTCHLTRFTGPADQVKQYEEAQRSRLENPDPAVVEKLRATVSVSARVYDGGGAAPASCLTGKAVPQRVVLTAKGSDTPALSIALEPEQATLKNRAGAEFAVVNGRGAITADELRPLAGKEYDFHLIYADRGYKDKWKAGYVDKLLKPSK